MKKRKKFEDTLKKAEVYGFIMKCSGACPFCDKTFIFLINCYDAKACLCCNQWLEKACSDPNCPYCANRPEFPLGAFAFMKEKIRREKQLLRKDLLRKNYQHKHDGELRHQKRILFYQELTK
ncbi:MAG: hypothetical protein IKI37_11995 [Oscillospiraceae bacterium]|nr:hypothetical protein [Oscillospiraceae bacterium]